MNDLLNLSTIFISLISLITLLIFIGKKIRNNSQLFMPKEYKTVQRIVNKISKKNMHYFKLSICIKERLYQIFLFCQFY